MTGAHDRHTRKGGRLRFVLLAAVAAVLLSPLAWMVSRSGMYGEVLSDRIDGEVPRFALHTRNTLLIALLSTPGMVLSSAVVAYGFSRVRWRGREAVFFFVLATMMIPFPILMAPLYLIFRELGWLGSFKPLWVPAWFGAAFNVYLLRQFFNGIPRELDEAARIDGCGHVGIFLRVILPLSKPALVMVAVFHFLYVWNDFLAPLVFLLHQDQFTLALGLSRYQSTLGGVRMEELLAASTLTIVPVMVLFFVAQRAFIRVGAGSGIKG
ncbi:MAG: carbohydrate ABC transporter permease [Planctomycetota bacterium]